MIRLDKLLKDCGLGSRKEVKEYIRKGLVSINDKIIKNDDYKVDEQNDIIKFNDQLITYEKYVYIMLNKPAGVVSATFDNKDKTVLDLIDEYYYKDLFPFGRLDKDTEGLLIMSNDGKLAHDLLSPKKHVEKKYYVEVDGVVIDEDIEIFKKGVIIDNELCKPALLEIIESNKKSKCYITITEGKYHQVKRMFESVNKKVLYLKRVTFGNIHLDENLQLGQYRKLTIEEIELLKRNDSK